MNGCQISRGKLIVGLIITSFCMTWLAGAWTYVFYLLNRDGKLLLMRDPLVPLEFWVAVLLFLVGLLFSVIAVKEY